MTPNDDLVLEALERRQLESDDLNREISGTQHSEHARFLNAYDDENDPRGQRKDKASTRDAHLTALQQMLTDPAYRALYEDTLDQLRRAQLAAETARDKADLVLEQAQVDMQAIREDANRLADGTRVYVDAPGNVRREDGTIVADADLEGGFEEILRGLKPADGVFRLASKVFRQRWDYRLATQEQRIGALNSEMNKLDKQIEQLLDRIVDAESTTVIRAFEKRTSEAEIRKAELDEKMPYVAVRCGTSKTVIEPR